MKLFSNPIALTACLLLAISPLCAEEPLAQPGFIGHERACSSNVFGFGTSSYMNERGIWAALLVTGEQGKQLSGAWLATWGKRIDEGLREPDDQPEMAALEKEYNLRRDEILTPEQKETVRQINGVSHELGQLRNDVSKDGMTFRDDLMEALQGILTPEQLAAIESFSGQGP